jgi:hypothetical protein
MELNNNIQKYLMTSGHLLIIVSRELGEEDIGEYQKYSEGDFGHMTCLTGHPPLFPTYWSAI